LISHEELAADDGPAVEPDVRSIEDIAMEAGAMVVEGDLERVHEWADAARKRLSELGHADAVLTIHAVEKAATTRKSLHGAPTELGHNRIRDKWIRGPGSHR
jgi:hypothetical protein